MDTQVIKEALGREIRRHRKAQDLSLTTLAVMCHTSYTHLWKVEQGRVGVGVDLLCRIAEALDVPLPKLLEPAWSEAFDTDSGSSSRL